MSETHDWLQRFSASQDSLYNPLVYRVALPMLIVGTVGLLWASPAPARFAEISPLLNWGSTFLMVVAIYYFIISLPLAIGMLPVLLGLAGVQHWIAASELPLRGVATGLVAAGLVGLLLGRAGRWRAIVEDLQLMMIAPLWLLASLYRRLGIPM